MLKFNNSKILLFKITKSQKKKSIKSNKKHRQKKFKTNSKHLKLEKQISIILKL